MAATVITKPDSWNSDSDCPSTIQPRRAPVTGAARPSSGGAAAGSRRIPSNQITKASAVATRLSRILPSVLRSDGGLTIGPFPKGLPVNLLSNLQPLPESKDPLVVARHVERLLRLLVDLKLYLATLPASATDAQMVNGIADRMGAALLALDKCPDFEVNRGHYFGTGMIAGEPGLSDSDKRALIEFVKTF